MNLVEGMYSRADRICLVCRDEDRLKKSGPVFVPSYDHIFPRLLGKEHTILAPLTEMNEDLAPLCLKHHRRVDLHKMKAYREKGVAGLVLQIGENYGRAVDPYFLALQQQNMEVLFKRLRNTLDSLNGHTPPESKADYVLAIRFADRFLAECDKGNFIKCKLDLLA